MLAYGNPPGAMIYQGQTGRSRHVSFAAIRREEETIVDRASRQLLVTRGAFQVYEGSSLTRPRHLSTARHQHTVLLKLCGNLTALCKRSIVNGVRHGGGTGIISCNVPHSERFRQAVAPECPSWCLTPRVQHMKSLTGASGCHAALRHQSTDVGGSPLELHGMRHGRHAHGLPGGAQPKRKSR